MSNQFTQQPSSFRDPSGFVFENEGKLYRQVNTVFKEDFDRFFNSGCYDKLVKEGLLISHKTITENLTGSANHYLTLLPEQISFISYPYEWSFDMLKDAALLTLQLVKEAVSFGLILKDATPYNIQWHKGNLVFIDTLSFERYNEEMPWIAYRQFCENFLSPLLLMHYSKRSMHELLLAYPEGIPLPVTSSLLPQRSKFSLHTYLHIHLHAAVSKKKKQAERKITFSKTKLINLISSLEGLIHKLRAPSANTTWGDYYEEAAQRSGYLENKKQIIQQWISDAGNIQTAADLGANDGVFSKMIAEKGIPVITTDFDPACINNLYNDIKHSRNERIQPLIIDLANPSPAIGVNNKERTSFIDRLDVDLTLALALIHHLSIGKNIPFDHVAAFFHQVTRKLIIEFVPKEDPKIQLMLTGRKDIYSSYTQTTFEAAFEKYFSIEKKQTIGGSGRILYFMTKK